MQRTDQNELKKNRKRKAAARMLRSLRTEVPLDDHLYRVEKTISSDGSIPEDYFFTKRIIQPIPKRMKQEDGEKKQERLFVPISGMQGLMRSLNEGRYDLLTFYLQAGIDPRGFIMKAYYSDEPEYQASIHLIGLISLIKTAYDELTEMDDSIDNIHCFPILDNEKRFSEEAKEYLIPYLKRLFIIREDQFSLIEEKFSSIPLSERFFATIRYDQAHRLHTLKMILRGLKKQFERNELTSEKIARVAYILESFGIILDEENIGSDINSMLEKLLNDHPELKSATKTSDFFNSIMHVHEVTFLPHVSHGNKALLHLIISPKIISIVAEHIFGRKNKVHLFYGLGIFSAQDIAKTMRLHSRIINIDDKNIERASIVHNAFTRAYSLAAHDILHFYRMSNIPYFIRETLLEFTNMIHKVTGFPLTYFSYDIIDMDYDKYVNVDESKRQSLDFNIAQLATIYHASIMNAKIAYGLSILQYHLVIVYEVLKNPQFIAKNFKSFNDYDESVADTVLAAMCATYEGLTLDTAHQGALYQKIKAYFDQNQSTANNVFHYIVEVKIPIFELSRFAKNLVLAISSQCNSFKWTRNDGLLIELDKDVYFNLSDMIDNYAGLNLNTSFVIPFIKSQLAAVDNRTALVNTLSKLMHSECNFDDGDEELLNEILCSVFNSEERENYLQATQPTVPTRMRF